MASLGYCWILLRIRLILNHPSSVKKTKFLSLIKRCLVFVTQMTGIEMALEFIKTMEVMSLRITRTRIRKCTSFSKQNQMAVNAPQFFSRGRTGRTLNIPTSAEVLPKYSDIMGTPSCLNNSNFYSTVSVESPMQITTKPHHNSKLGKAFTRTKPGVLESIKGKVKGSAPLSQACEQVCEEDYAILVDCYGNK